MEKDMLFKVEMSQQSQERPQGHKSEVSGVIVNWSSAVRVESLPFGGIKLGGHGREALHDTVNEMTEQKTILMHNVLS